MLFVLLNTLRRHKQLAARDRCVNIGAVYHNAIFQHSQIYYAKHHNILIEDQQQYI